MNGCLRRIPELLPLQYVTIKFLEFKVRQSDVSLQLWNVGFPSFSPFFFKLNLFHFQFHIHPFYVSLGFQLYFAFSRFSLSSSILSWLRNLSFSIPPLISICFSLFLCSISNCFSFPLCFNCFSFYS